MIFSISQSELDALHPDLRRVLIEFGKRSKLNTFLVETERSQKQAMINLSKGVSWTKKSRHVRNNNKSKFAEAFDLAPCSSNGKKIFWNDIETCRKMNVEIMSVAKSIGISIEWGGNWKEKKDFVHWQLARKYYPANG
jgi:peptidoglycan LD-endopeptidase CwlK